MFNGLILVWVTTIGGQPLELSLTFLVVIAIFTGIAQGIQPILSRSYGKGDQRCLASILRYAVIVTLVLSDVIYGGVLLFAPEISSIFNSEGDPALQQIAVQGLKLYFLACPLRDVTCAFHLLHFHRPFQGSPCNLLAPVWFFLIIPLAFFLSWLWGMTGIWITFPVTEFLGSSSAWGIAESNYKVRRFKDTA